MEMVLSGLQLALCLLPAVIMGLALVLGLLFSGANQETRIIDGNGVLTEYEVRQRNVRIFERLERKLKKLGASYHGIKDASIGSFFSMQILCGTLLFMLLGLVNIYMGFAGFLAGMLLPLAYLHIGNSTDNEKIAYVLLRIYKNIINMCSSGLSLREALMETEQLACMKRLRDAFDKLSEDIKRSEDTITALTTFRECFDCEYIDSFCITMMMELDSKGNEDVMEELYAELSELRDVVSFRREQKLEGELMMYRMGVILAGCMVFLSAGIIGIIDASILK